MMTSSAIMYINKFNKLGESLWSVLVGILFCGALYQCQGGEVP